MHLSGRSQWLCPLHARETLFAQVLKNGVTFLLFEMEDFE